MCIYLAIDKGEQMVLVEQSLTCFGERRQSFLVRAFLRDSDNSLHCFSWVPDVYRGEAFLRQKLRKIRAPVVDREGPCKQRVRWFFGPIIWSNSVFEND